MKRFALRYADWSWREYAAAAGCVLRGRIATGAAQARLAQQLDGLYAPARAFPVNYGHTALRIALDAFRQRRPDRSQVIVPAYICPSVVETVRAAGLEPVAADVGADLNLTPSAVSALLSGATLAVVVPHMYGCPAAVEMFERLCSEAGVYMVDDAAQVVGETVGGRLLGTFGDVGIVSFAQSKAVVTGVRGSGGVLVVNKPEWLDTMADAWRRLPPARGRLAALLHFLWHYQWAPYTGRSGYYLGRLQQALGWRPAAADQGSAIGNLDAAIALVQLSRLDQLRAGKASVLAAYQAALASVACVNIPQYATGCYLSRVMLSLPPGTDIKRLRHDLASDGVQTRLGYQNQVVPGVPDSPQVAMARRLLGLPFCSTLEKDAVNKICSILTKNLAAQKLASFQHTQNQ